MTFLNKDDHFPQLDPYLVLGLTDINNRTDNDIKRAFKFLARDTHPDKSPRGLNDDEKTARALLFRNYHDAKHFLLDDGFLEDRLVYFRFLHERENPPQPDPDSPFFHGTTKYPAPGMDPYEILEIDPRTNPSDSQIRLNFVRLSSTPGITEIIYDRLKGALNFLTSHEYIQARSRWKRFLQKAIYTPRNPMDGGESTGVGRRNVGSLPRNAENVDDWG